MSQPALAAASGVSQSTISRIERGDGGHTHENARALAKALGVRVAELDAEAAEAPEESGGSTPGYHVVPDGEALSVPILRNYPNWTELVEAAKALSSKVPDWTYETLEQRSPFLVGPLHPAAVLDLAKLVMKYESPPPRPPATEPTKKTKRPAK